MKDNAGKNKKGKRMKKIKQKKSRMGQKHSKKTYIFIRLYVNNYKDKWIGKKQKKKIKTKIHAYGTALTSTE